MKACTRKFIPKQQLVLFAALLSLWPLNTVQAQSDGNILSEILSSLQPFIQPQPAPQPYTVSGICNGRYEVVVTQVNGNPVSQVLQFGQFQGLGTGRTPVRQAKENAERCMQSQWQSRQNRMPPHECVDQQRISGYTVRDFDQTLQQEVCQSINPLSCSQGSADVRYSIYALVDGGPGCGTHMSSVARTLLASGSMIQCICHDDRRGDRGWGRGRDDRRGDRDWDRGRDGNRSGRGLAAPQQITPVQGAVFYHLPRRTLLTWQPVQRAESYQVEIKYKGRIWNTLNTSGEATFVSFDFPGPGRGKWRVIPLNRRGRQGTPSPWFRFTYQR